MRASVVLLEHKLGYLQSPGGVGRVGFFPEKPRCLGALVEQMLSGHTLSLGDVPDLTTHTKTSQREEELEKKR